MELYHRDIRLPDGFRLPSRLVTLRYTRHAERARNDDRYGYIPPIPVVDLGQCDTVEVGIENGKVVKVVVRTELDSTRDIIFVLMPHVPVRDVWTVKTVWVNLRTDSHKTLDRSKYVH